MQLKPPTATHHQKARGRFLGIALLCVAVPVMRDLLVRQHPGSGAVLAALGYLGLLAATLVTMRIAGISAADAGIRSICWRSAFLGVIGGVLLVVPVWRTPLVSVADMNWLLVPVVVEEVAFRGVLFAVLQRAGGLPLAVGGSAALFTLAHLGSAGLPGVALVALAGLFLGLLRALRNDLWAPGIAHLLMDLVSRP
ncbi:MAG: hypothetical protein PVSMB9_08140 [Candidatus Dormibacteria bacterium]